MPRHTAGGIVIGEDGRMVLVLQNKNSWSFPKGGIDEGETPREAAVREIWEETGIRDLVFVGDLGVYERHSLNKEGTGENTDVPPAQRTMYLFTTLEAAFAPQEEESEPRWVTVDEALAMLTHEKDREFLTSIRRRIEMIQ